MGLFRLWWVPAGMSPDRGAYVRYPHQAMAGVFTGEAVRAGALAIGEDLGTVEDWVRDYLAARGVLGTSMLWFERRRDGVPLPPAQWRHHCLATVGTHDVPPVAAFVTGEQVTLRAGLGLLAREPAAERAAAARPCRPGRTPWPGRGSPRRPAGPGGVHRRALRLSRAHSGRAGGGVAGGRGRGAPPAEPARYHHAVPELVRPAGRRRRAAGPAGGPGRPPGRAHRRGGGQPAWRSRSWQRSARSAESRPSMSRRRSGAGGSVLEIRASVASITEWVSDRG